MEKSTKRRQIHLELLRCRDRMYAKISPKGAEVFKDQKMEEPIIGLVREHLDIGIPYKIKQIEINRTYLSPIIELGLNRKLWPKEGMKDLRLVLDKQDISLVDEKGNFKETKYKQLCNAMSFKKWALLLYKRMDGTLDATLWWKL